jgi:WD40 repeat protein
VKFSPDSKLLVASKIQDMVYLWDISSQKPKELKAPQNESIIKDVAFSPNGKILIASQKTGDPLNIWDISSQRWQKLEGQQWDKLAKLEGILHVEFSPDGKLLITTLGNGTVYLWDTAGQHWEKLKSLQDVRNAEFSSDSKFLIVYQIDKVGIWDISGNKWSKKPEEPPIRERVKLSPDGKYVATIDEKNNNTLRLWDIPSQQWKDFEEKLQYIFNIDSEVEFSPNGKILATINENSNILRLWDMSGQQLKRFKPIPNIELVKFSPNGNLLSYRESDKTINLWDTFGEQLTELKTEQGELVSTTFSPDSKLLVTLGRKNGNPRVWHIGGLDEVLSINCDWVRDYLKNPNANLSESDRRLCDGIGNWK